MYAVTHSVYVILCDTMFCETVSQHSRVIVPNAVQIATKVVTAAFNSIRMTTLFRHSIRFEQGKFFVAIKS